MKLIDADITFCLGDIKRIIINKKRVALETIKICVLKNTCKRFIGHYNTANETLSIFSKPPFRGKKCNHYIGEKNESIKNTQERKKGKGRSRKKIQKSTKTKKKAGKK